MKLAKFTPSLAISSYIFRYQDIFCFFLLFTSFVPSTRKYVYITRI